jgi:hypothetical protein
MYARLLGSILTSAQFQTCPNPVENRWTSEKLGVQAWYHLKHHGSVFHGLPVVPHKAVAEVSKIGNL